MSKEKKEFKYLRFTLLMDDIKSVIDPSLSKKAMKQIILDEIEKRFSDKPLYDFGETRCVGDDGGHLQGRYLISKNTPKD
jgi:hypothetical protein